MQLTLMTITHAKPARMSTGDPLEDGGRHDSSGSNGAGAAKQKPGKGRVAAAKRQAAGADDDEAEDDAGTLVVLIQRYQQIPNYLVNINVVCWANGAR